MKKFFRNTKIISCAGTALVSAALLASCQMGLGDAVDLTAPVLTITSPDYMANIGKNFTVTGTARDNVEVTKLSVSFAGNSWTYENGVWSGQNAEQATFVKGSDKNVSWSVPLSLPETVEDSQYVIMVSAYDKQGNTSETSIQSRTVIYDTTAPVVTVTQPALNYSTYQSISADYNESDYRNFEKLSEYHNGTLEISGYQDEDYTLKSLEVWLCGASDDEIYYDSGLITENLRNWNLTITGSDLKKDGAVLAEKTFMQIVTKSIDAADNETIKRSHGWICWWPDADTPWVSCDHLKSTEAAAEEIYPKSTLQGTVYDDDGISSVTLKLYGGEDYSELKTTVEKNYSSEAQSTTFLTWGFTLPSTTGTYKVTVEAKDTEDNTAQTLSGYLKIRDVTAPSISVSSPDQNSPLFGDKNGSINFAITAGDDSGVDSIQMVWLKDKSTVVNYLDTEYDQWEKVSPSSTTYTDEKGNKMWYIAPGEGKTDGTRTAYSASLSLNLFTDLNIGPEDAQNSLTSQEFIFRVQDNNSKATTLEYNCQGDNQTPQVSFGNFTVISGSDSTETVYSIQDLAENKTILRAIGSTDKIIIDGTWSDNSTEVWPSSRISDISLTWGSTAVPVTKNADGTWTTAAFENLKTSSISLKASLTDYARNTGNTTAAFSAEAETPELLSISSTASDGTYPAGTEITLKMKFNKAVYFDTNPYLVLSNGKTAEFTETQGNTSWYFKYTAEDGDDCENLDVTAVKDSPAARTVQAQDVKSALKTLTLAEQTWGRTKTSTSLQLPRNLRAVPFLLTETH